MKFILVATRMLIWRLVGVVFKPILFGFINCSVHCPGNYTVTDILFGISFLSILLKIKAVFQFFWLSGNSIRVPHSNNFTVHNTFTEMSKMSGFFVAQNSFFVLLS